MKSTREGSFEGRMNQRWMFVMRGGEGHVGSK